MKIVINSCFGGFSISTSALLELVKRNAACIGIRTPEQYYGFDKNLENKKRWDEVFEKYTDLGDGFKAHSWEFNIYKDGVLYYLNSDDSIRTDKDLIEVVEKLGEEAN